MKIKYLVFLFHGTPDDLQMEMKFGSKFGIVSASQTVTSRYDVPEHLRTPEEMAAYLWSHLSSAEDRTKPFVRRSKPCQRRCEHGAAFLLAQSVESFFHQACLKLS